MRHDPQQQQHSPDQALWPFWIFKDILFNQAMYRVIPRYFIHARYRVIFYLMNYLLNIDITRPGQCNYGWSWSAFFTVFNSFSHMIQWTLTNHLYYFRYYNLWREHRDEQEQSDHVDHPAVTGDVIMMKVSLRLRDKSVIIMHHVNNITQMGITHCIAPRYVLCSKR